MEAKEFNEAKDLALKLGATAIQLIFLALIVTGLLMAATGRYLLAQLAERLAAEQQPALPANV